jgi:hypothetical protein
LNYLALPCIPPSEYLSVRIRHPSDFWRDLQQLRQNRRCISKSRVVNLSRNFCINIDFICMRGYEPSWGFVEFAVRHQCDKQNTMHSHWDYRVRNHAGGIDGVPKNTCSWIALEFFNEIVLHHFCGSFGGTGPNASLFDRTKADKTDMNCLHTMACYAKKWLGQ